MNFDNWTNSAKMQLNIKIKLNELRLLNKFPFEMVKSWRNWNCLHNDTHYIVKRYGQRFQKCSKAFEANFIIRSVMENMRIPGILNHGNAISIVARTNNFTEITISMEIIANWWMWWKCNENQDLFAQYCESNTQVICKYQQSDILGMCIWSMPGKCISNIWSNIPPSQVVLSQIPMNTVSKYFAIFNDIVIPNNVYDFVSGIRDEMAI